MDCEFKCIELEVYCEVEMICGCVDVEVMEIYVWVYNQLVDLCQFYEFFKMMEIFEMMIDKEMWLMFLIEGDFYKFF